MIDRDIEEALNLLGMEVHRQDAICAGSDEQVGDEFGGDGDAGLVLAVLPCIAVEGQNCGNPIGAGAAYGIDHDEKFHQVMVGGRAGGLNDEDVFATNVFLDFDESFAIGKRFDGRFADFDAD